jgi:hypothetical protein
VTGPTPGTEVRISSASRQAGVAHTPASMSASTSVSSFSRKATWRSIGLHADHLDHLPSPCDEFAQHLGLLRSDGPGLRPDLFGEERDDFGIYGGGLGKLAERLR